ncbi:MAG: cell cycle transcriptional regulator TrcR [Devosia sp.]
MATSLLMPKATAVWLVDNTALSFEQIAAFCSLHPLEVQGVADGDVAGGIMGVNPLQNGQLTREEIEKAEADPEYRMQLLDPKVHVPATKRRGPRYTPISRRTERPNAIRWLLRNHPELKDAQIMRLVGTTKSTIDSVRDNSHWNSTNIQPMDPVTLGLCSQIDLDLEVKRAAAKSGGPASDEAEHGTMLMSAEEALATAGGRSGATDAPASGESHRPEHEEDLDADSVFAKLKSPRNTDATDRE